jgi:hypothetical protein
MSLNDEIQIRYMVLPRKHAKPVKVDKILEERLLRHRSARELRLASLEKA